MKREYLLSYKLDDFHQISSTSTQYVMKIKVVWFWGVWTTLKRGSMEILYNESTKSYTDHWDKLIEKQKRL